MTDRRRCFASLLASVGLLCWMVPAAAAAPGGRRGEPDHVERQAPAGVSDDWLAQVRRGIEADQ